MLRGILCSLSYNFQQILIAQIAALQHESPLFLLGILDFFGSRTFFFFNFFSCFLQCRDLFFVIGCCSSQRSHGCQTFGFGFSLFSLLFFGIFFPCLPAATSAVVRPPSAGGAGQARLNDDTPSSGCISEAGVVGLRGPSVPEAIANFMFLCRSINSQKWLNKTSLVLYGYGTNYIHAILWCSDK